MRKLALACCYICFVLVGIILWHDITNPTLDSLARGWQLGCDMVVLVGMVALTNMMDRITR